jgi:hypothetical protein
MTLTNVIINDPAQHIRDYLPSVPDVLLTQVRPGIYRPVEQLELDAAVISALRARVRPPVVISTTVIGRR